MRAVLALVAAAVTTGWGVAHLFPTRSVVEGFGDIGAENERVIAICAPIFTASAILLLVAAAT